MDILLNMSNFLDYEYKKINKNIKYIIIYNENWYSRSLSNFKIFKFNKIQY